MNKQPDAALNSVYQEICDALGIDAANTIYNMFKGQQISFPLRFYNPQSVRARIAEEYNGSNIRALAIKYNYSERTVRRIVQSAEDSKK